MAILRKVHNQGQISSNPMDGDYVKIGKGRRGKTDNFGLSVRRRWLTIKESFKRTMTEFYAACFSKPSLCRVAVASRTKVNTAADEYLSFALRYLEQVSRKSEQYHAKYGHNPWRANGAFWLWNLAQLFKFKRSMRPKSDTVCRIGFVFKGGIGDMLISLNFLQNFHRFLEGICTFDLYVQKKRGYSEIVRTLCREQNFIQQVLPVSQLKHDYDLYIEIVRFPDILYFHESKIRTLCPQLHQWCLAVDQFRRNNPVVYRYGTYGDFIGTQLAILQGHSQLTQADIDDIVHVESIFQPKILADTHETLAKFSLENKRFMTMQRGIGAGDHNVSTRLWPFQHYEALAKLIKEQMPEIRIVQVGTKETLPIKGVDIDLRTKTSFEDVMVLMRQSCCHIDGECGLVHLRHFLHGGPSVVLFGPTDIRFKGYADNINLQSDACAGGCEWISAGYNSTCPRGFTENVCLSRLSPETVLSHVMKTLKTGHTDSKV